jgi:uncharacterized membrane protein YbhN (UPF0104 family)
MTSPRLGRWILVLLLLTAGVNLLLVLLGGGAGKLLLTLEGLPLGFWPLAIAILLGAYGVSFSRWQWYLSRLGAAPPLLPSLRIFLAGYALIASPGRAGEGVRSLILHRDYGVSRRATLGAMLCERICDLASALLIFGLGWTARGGSVLPLLAVLVASIGLPQLAAPWLHRLRRWLKPGSKRDRTVEHLALLLDSARQLLRPLPLLVGIGLSLLMWSVEGALLQMLFRSLGAGIDGLGATVIRAAIGLGGILTLLPGGVGGAEATGLLLARGYGASMEQAIAATLIIRTLTLWFPIGLGCLALGHLQLLADRSPRQ